MSKKLILSLALSGLVLTATAQTTVAPAIPRDEKIEQQIETLLKKMTLDEKVGQMCELTIDLLQKRANPFAGLDHETGLPIFYDKNGNTSATWGSRTYKKYTLYEDEIKLVKSGVVSPPHTGGINLEYRWR